MPETTRPAVGKYWVFFFISLAAFVLFLMFLTPFFWVTLPFLLTSLCAATRLI